MSAWFAAKMGLNDDWNSIVNWGKDDTKKRFGFSLQKGKYVFTSQGDANKEDIRSTNLGNDGNWHHLVATYDGTTVAFVVDNVGDGKLGMAGSPLQLDTTESKLIIGRKVPDGNDEYFQGSIDDIRIYNRVLTTAEIAALYHEKGWK